MNKATVGMENLPNVFIDKIISEPRVVSFDSEIIQYNVKVVVKMYDHVNYSWYNKVPGLKVKCAFVTDDRITQLNNGDISLYDIPLGAIHKATAQSCDSFRFSRNDNGYKSFVSTFEYNTLTAPQNLNVYVACFIDDLNFGIPQFDKFYGPMAAEVIFVGGQLNQSSNYFYDPETNEEYGGPVHFHSQGYMEGSEHTAEPHRQLRLVEEENYKIVAPSEYDISADRFEYETRTTSSLEDSPQITLPEPSQGSSSAYGKFEESLDDIQEPDLNLVGEPNLNIPGLPS